MKPEIKDEISKIVAEVLTEQKSTIEKIVADYLSKKQTEQKPEPIEEIELPELESKKLPLYNSYINKNKPDKKILFRLNLDLYDRLAESAKKREISEASFIRESIMYRTIRNKMGENTNLTELFDKCSVWTYGKGKTLQLGGERGFINQIKERKLTGSLWTPEYLDKLVFALIDNKEARTLVDDWIGALELNREQMQFLGVSFREIGKHSSPLEE